MNADKKKAEKLRRAEQLRLIAEDTRGESNRKLLLKVAADYDRIAKDSRASPSVPRRLASDPKPKGER